MPASLRRPAHAALAILAALLMTLVALTGAGGSPASAATAGRGLCPAPDVNTGGKLTATVTPGTPAPAWWLGTPKVTKAAGGAQALTIRTTSSKVIVWQAGGKALVKGACTNIPVHTGRESSGITIITATIPAGAAFAVIRVNADTFDGRVTAAKVNSAGHLVLTISNTGTMALNYTIAAGNRQPVFSAIPIPGGSHRTITLSQVLPRGATSINISLAAAGLEDASYGYRTVHLTVHR